MNFPIHIITKNIYDFWESHIDDIYNRLSLSESVSTYGAYNFPEIKKRFD